MNLSLRCGLLLLWACSLMGCQSTRPSFSFQPAPLAAAPPSVVAEANISLAPTGPSATAAPEPLPTIASLLRRAARHPKRPAAAAARRQLADRVALPLLKRPLGHRRPFLVRRQAAAEAGLGTTVLGVLGLVALPVAAVGLILSGGGLAWIIVGGLAALAVLVAYIDPFGR